MYFFFFLVQGIKPQGFSQATHMSYYWTASFLFSHQPSLYRVLSCSITQASWNYWSLSSPQGPGYPGSFQQTPLAPEFFELPSSIWSSNFRAVTSGHFFPWNVWFLWQFSEIYLVIWDKVWLEAIRLKLALSLLLLSVFVPANWIMAELRHLEYCLSIFTDFKST